MKREARKPDNCVVDITEEDLKNYYVNRWVWKWVEQFHPEAFTKAREYVNKHWKKNNVEKASE